MILDTSHIKLDGVLTSDYGVFPKERYPIPSAERHTETIEIKGRDGSLTRKYGYQDIPYPLKFYIKSDNFRKTFRKAKQYLLDAKMLQILEDDDVYYKIKSVVINEADNMFLTFGEFEVSFTLDPFMYQYQVDIEPIIVTSQTTITNDGYTALPTITAQVNGTGKVYINEQEITINNVNGEITIDSEMQNAYRAGSPPQNMNKHMIGVFPVLEHGDNVIEFSGDIEKLELIKNLRWR